MKNTSELKILDSTALFYQFQSAYEYQYGYLLRKFSHVMYLTKTDFFM
jgi:hypothetical protein